MDLFPSLLPVTECASLTLLGAYIDRTHFSINRLWSLPKRYYSW